MALKASNVKVGDSREVKLVEEITRTRIVQYSGASGDFNPLHSDEVFATQVAGYPSTFAHGMLTMGITGRVITDWVGADQILSYGVRFLAQVWPGDSLIANAEVTAITEGPDGSKIAEFKIVTTNQNGNVVVSGTATARLA